MKQKPIVVCLHAYSSGIGVLDSHAFVPRSGWFIGVFASFVTGHLKTTLKIGQYVVCYVFIS